MEAERKELAHEIEMALEKLQVEAAPDIDTEKTLALERLEAFLHQEEEKREHRKRERIRAREDEKRRQLLEECGKEAIIGHYRENSGFSEERLRSGGEEGWSEREEREKAGNSDGRSAADDGWLQTGGDSDRAQEDGGIAGSKWSTEDLQANAAAESGGEESDEEEAMEMLDPTFFLEQAEAKVRYEKTCTFICHHYGELLAGIENMFIALTSSAKQILAACLLLLGEPASSLRQNSKLPQSDWDWQKLRARMGASLVQRLSHFLPEAPRPPPPPPSHRSTADTDVARLYQITQVIEELSALPEEMAPLLESSPALFLLETWVKLAIDYRRKCLITRAAILLREARRKKAPLPQLEMEIDVDFQNILLPSVLSTGAS